MEGGLFIGTSGWIYKGWAGTFYPPEIKSPHHLEFYAARFNTVEINATFYRLPLVGMVKGWFQRSPGDFLFAVKGSRFITHMKKLNVDKTSIKKFFDRIKPLKEKCGPILWQLPPNFGYNPERLDAFLKVVPTRHEHAVEFRHPSWYGHAETFEILRKHGAAHVSVSSLRMAMNLNVTADSVYIRFHGLEHGAAHDYTQEEMQPWADHCRRCLDNGIAVYAYFNNDWNTRAPANAETFKEMITTKEPASARKKRRASIKETSQFGTTSTK